jgi:hypothetical protein
MCVHLCILASSRILQHDPGDKHILSDGGVTAVLCTNPLLPASHVRVIGDMLDWVGMRLRIPFSRDLSLFGGGGGGAPSERMSPRYPPGEHKQCQGKAIQILKTSCHTSSCSPIVPHYWVGSCFGVIPVVCAM